MCILKERDIIMIEYEKYHLDADNRRTGAYLEVLHHDFKEFGQSGGIITRKDLKQSILDSSTYEIEDFNVVELSMESKLCTYVLNNKTTGRVSNRSSVWVRYNDDWRLFFHQGTTRRSD